MADTLELALRVRADLAQAVQGLNRLERELTGAAAAGQKARAGARAAARGLDETAQAAHRASGRLRVLEVGLGGVAANIASALAAAAKGTALEGGAARAVFTAVAEASRVMGLTGAETRGALTALEQIISKGTVSAEELRGQLGERLPGAFQIASRAMGVTTAELGAMLQRGEVLADEFLPRFAAELRATFGDAATEAGASAGAAFERLDNAIRVSTGAQ